jgi:hypothetical protein
MSGVSKSLEVIANRLIVVELEAIEGKRTNADARPGRNADTSRERTNGLMVKVTFISLRRADKRSG